MSKSVLILGAGFGGLELSAMLSEELGDEVDVTFIDRNDSFSFGEHRIARVDIDFLSGPEKAGVFNAPSAELRAE